MLFTPPLFTRTHTLDLFEETGGASNRRTDPEPKGGASLCRLGFGGGDLGRDNLSGTENSRRALRGRRTRDLHPPRLYRGSTPGERRDRQSCAIGGKDPRAHGREPETVTRWPSGPREDSTHDPCPGPLLSHSCPPLVVPLWVGPNGNWSGLNWS